MSLFCRFERSRYLLQLLLKANGRGLTTRAEPADVLGRWLKSWDLATPPVSFLPGTDPPTAMSWLRRRGPALPDALLHKLFRQEVVRSFDPATAKISRVRKTKELPPGCQLLIPKGVGEEAGAGAAPQRDQQAQQRAPALAPEQQDQRMAWVRELRRRVLFHDADLIAVDKPAGLAVQGGSGVAVSVDAIMGTAFDRLVPDPSSLRLVHRLDQQTSGVLVIAKTLDAAAWLSQGFRSGTAAAAAAEGQGMGTSQVREAGRAAAAASSSSSGGSRGGVEIRKTYHAIVAKELPRDVAAGWDQTVPDLEEQGSIDLPVSAGGGGGGSSSSSRGGFTGASRSRGSSGGGADSALPALTKFTLRRQNDQVAWLELRPQTGRKHQLRIHCAQGLGTPILGDSKYGAVRSPVQRGVLGELREEGAWSGDTPPMFLHCRSLLIKKPEQDSIRVIAQLPPHWQALLKLQRWGAPSAAPGMAAGRQQSTKRTRLH